VTESGFGCHSRESGNLHVDKSSQVIFPLLLTIGGKQNMDLFIAILVGFITGAHTSIWGMYKDSPHEGFTNKQFFRSIIIAGIWAPIIWTLTRLDMSSAPSFWLLFGSTYAMERLTLEFYKTFLREQDQSKYTIPMQFAVFGKVVKSRAVRLSVAAAYITGILLIGGGLLYLDSHRETLAWSPWLTVFIVGSVGGWVSAFGGAWKDAPIEGFETFKFFRSPAMAFFYGILTAFFTTNYFLITLCAIGYTIATIETYKTFFFPSKPRGKFANTPIHFPEQLQKRQKYVPVYVAIWLGIIVTFVMAMVGPHEGLL
jgi:hypothetical protein